MIIFNWTGLAEMLAVGAGASLLAALLWTAGLPFDIVSSVVLGLAGVVLISVDYGILRRRREPLSPMWRLGIPGAGGHLFFVPCWAIGAASLALGWAVLCVVLRSGPYPDLPEAFYFLGLGGFAFPFLYEYFVPFDLPKKEAPTLDRPTSIDPS